MNYDIVETTENFDPDVLLPLWKDALPDLDERRVDWSYRGNPGGPAHMWYLNEAASGRPCGACAVLPRDFFLGGRKIRGGIASDFAIKKEHRSLGPALKLQRAVSDSMDFDAILAFPNQSAMGVQLRAGFHDMGNMTVFRKIFRSRDLLKRRYHPVLSMIAAPFVDAAVELRSLSFSGGTSRSYSVVHSLDEKFADFWKRVKDRFGCIGDRSTDYLQWRFLSHPYKSYAFFGLIETASSRPIGHLVYYVKDRIAYVDDVLFGDPQADLSALVDAFSSHCRKSRLDAISLMMLQNEKYASLLRKLNFFPEKTDQKLLVACRDIESFKKTDLFVTRGDRDI